VSDLIQVEIVNTVSVGPKLWYQYPCFEGTKLMVRNHNDNYYVVPFTAETYQAVSILDKKMPTKKRGELLHMLTRGTLFISRVHATPTVPPKTKLRIFYKSGGMSEVEMNIADFRLTSDILEVKVINKYGQCAV
jgi:hypothetical protein